jgi:hypothetical protein
MAGGVVVAKELTVLGSTVIVEDGYTAFGEGYSFDTIMENDIVEVSGLADANGDIRATRIELEDVWTPGTPLEVELRGESTGVRNQTVAGINNETENTGDLIMGGIGVSYTDSTTFEPANFDTGRFSSSVFIEVEGTLQLTNPILPESAENPLIVVASEIEEEDDFGEDADKISVEGFVSGYVNDSEFFVGSQEVDASGATFIPTGLPLKDNDEVEVEGPLVAGVIEATEVKFGEESKVSATIEALGDNTLTLLGSIVVGFDGGTRWEDKQNSNAPFNFSSLQVGDFVEVRAVYVPADDPAAEDELVATRIERDEPDGIEVEGRVGEDKFCADPTATELIPNPDPEADPESMISVLIAPCEEDTENLWHNKAWVEVLGLRVEIRETTDLEVGDVVLTGANRVADFINQIGTNFVELEIDPVPTSAGYLALEAEVETAP